MYHPCQRRGGYDDVTRPRASVACVRRASCAVCVARTLVGSLSLSVSVSRARDRASGVCVYRTVEDDDDDADDDGAFGWRR